jgi:hydroxymethylpyrimidine kinase / phosphomethylpyrimidine kinase / thiamine-phosphate diphosphorylase
MTHNDHPLRLVVSRDKEKTAIKGLYLVTDQGDNLAERVAAALSGGVSVVQYRNKERDDERRSELGWEIKQVCSAAGVTFIVNDDLELVRELDADGVHLGQDDGSVAEARRQLGPKKIIGVSTHDLDEALRAEADGADYIGFGAMYPTGSKEIVRLVGPASIPDVRERVSIPIVAIGGINRDNVATVIDAGADAVAVISAVLGAADPAAAAAELSLLFNRTAPFPRGVVLSIAGSDSGGGAGIQADIKTGALLGSYIATALTALTAQNTRGVSSIHGLPPSFVEHQMEAVFSDIPVDVVKTGMLNSAEVITSVAEKLTEFRQKIVVVDPVMVAKGGATLMDRDAVVVLRTALLPLAYLLTPNIPEAERLTGTVIRDEEGMATAARLLHGMGARNVLVKGGHLMEGESVDLLYDGSGFTRFAMPRILSKNTHGTGCTFSTAIACFLAQGEPLGEAVRRAKEFITVAIKTARPLGRGHGPVNHYVAALSIR